jgi:GntR family transcriptional regulator
VTAQEFTLQYDSPMPLYRQIANHLYSEIANGTLAPGAPIGSEAELQQRFNVSRVTLRQAVGLLVEQGLIVRKQGKGTFVETAPLEFPLDALQGTTQLATTLGRTTNSRVLSMRTNRGTAEVRRLLAISAGEKVTQIARLDSAGSGPLAYAIIHMPATLGQKLTRRELADEALYPLLESKLGVVASQAHQTMQAGSADGAIAESLKIPDGAPILTVTRITKDEKGHPFEHSVIRFRADAIQFSISLRRDKGRVDLPFRYHENLLLSEGAAVPGN